MGRFRLKFGDLELEYEGEDSPSKLEAISQWALEQAKTGGGIHRGDTTKPHEASPEKLKQKKPAKPISVEVVLPEKGQLGILEFSKSEVRFPAKAISSVDISGAIGLLLFEVGKPLKPEEIWTLLNRGYKQISLQVVRNYLSLKQYRISKMVIREEGGFRLTGEGSTWVKDEVVTSLKASKTSQTRPKGKNSESD